VWDVGSNDGIRCVRANPVNNDSCDEIAPAGIPADIVRRVCGEMRDDGFCMRVEGGLGRGLLAGYSKEGQETLRRLRSSRPLA